MPGQFGASRYPSTMDEWRGQPQSIDDYGVLLASDVQVPMRDGIRLATDLFFPAEPTAADRRVGGRFPVVLLRTPYNKRDAAMRELGEYFARRGYVMAIQDCRGRYASEGTFYFLAQEPEDGYDTIEWLGTQSWSTGAVGTMGTSYPGWTQTSAAALDPPHLAAMVVNQSGSNAYTSSVRHNGAMELRFLSWAFMEAGTTPAVAGDPDLAAALGSVSALDWLRNLPIRPGLTPLARIPSIERWALDIYTRGDYDGLLGPARLQPHEALGRARRRADPPVRRRGTTPTPGRRSKTTWVFPNARPDRCSWCSVRGRTAPSRST